VKASDQKVEFFITTALRTSDPTHHVSIIKTSRLILFIEIITVYSENHTKHINPACGKNAEILILG
jgi:hypothetical protein